MLAPGDHGQKSFLGPVTKRERSRTAIYWPRIWPTRGETRNDLETPDARAMDADRFHSVGPRRRDLHLAHRRGQAEINLWYAAGRSSFRTLIKQPKPQMKSADSEKLTA